MIDLKNCLEWLLNLLISNIVSAYFLKTATRLFPGLGRVLVTGRAWVTGGKVLYAGGYEDFSDPERVIFLRRGCEFPAGVDGSNTSWRMTIWDAGEAEEAARGCWLNLVKFVAVLAIAVLLYSCIAWYFSIIPSGPP